MLKKYRLFLFDMDGTIYLGDKLYDFTLRLLKAIRDKGKRYLFVTNNSSKSVADYVRKLERIGIKATEEDFLTSSQATAYYLKKRFGSEARKEDGIRSAPEACASDVKERPKFTTRLYVCGTESLKRELSANGFEVTGDIEKTDCVVMGFDTELTFRKLEDVCRILSARPDIPYIATNPDYVCPTQFGSVPDCGSVCDMIYNATGKRPVVIGKPSPLMLRLAMEKYGCSEDETAVIGDRIYTDIKSGLNAGVLTILVMSGETTSEILAASKDKPDLVLKDAGEMIEML